MPKSNFNQFLDECEDFRPIEKTSSSMSKISFEREPSNPSNPNPSTPHHYHECENQNNQNYPSRQNTSCGAPVENSFKNMNMNIFSSKKTNVDRDRDRELGAPRP